MSNKSDKWANFKKKHAEKRRRKEEKQPDAVDYLTVERLTAGVEGKCQKYSRIGPLAIVPFKYDTVTLDNIKKACKSYFDVASFMSCDVLAGERGPSYTSIDQVKSLKLLHVRFYIDDKVTEKGDDEGLDSIGIPASSSRSAAKKTKVGKPDKITVEYVMESRRSLTLNSPPKVVQQSAFPKSVPLSSLLQLGKLIPPVCDQEIMELYLEEFSIEKRQWLMPFPVKVSVSKSHFASGAFRNAFDAQVISGLKGRYVLKRYKPDQIKAIEELFGSVDDHTRKSVQMHSLARYYLMLLEKQSSTLAGYGDTFRYSKVYLARNGGELVTLELYLEGEFIKYINNDGNIVVRGSEVASKAEVFAHFTYVKSQKAIMVLDIQGTGYSLCDPEIASTKLLDQDSHTILFCCGNLSTQAIEQFFAEHKCGKHCALLGLNTM